MRCRSPVLLHKKNFESVPSGTHRVSAVPSPPPAITASLSSPRATARPEQTRFGTKSPQMIMWRWVPPPRYNTGSGLVEVPPFRFFSRISLPSPPPPQMIMWCGVPLPGAGSEHRDTLTLLKVLELMRWYKIKLWCLPSVPTIPNHSIPTISTQSSPPPPSQRKLAPGGGPLPDTILNQEME